MDTQSERAISTTWNEMKMRGMFDRMTVIDIKALQIKLGQIALAGFMDAKNAATDGIEKTYTELSIKLCRP